MPTAKNTLCQQHRPAGLYPPILSPKAYGVLVRCTADTYSPSMLHRLRKAAMLDYQEATTPPARYWAIHRGALVTRAVKAQRRKRTSPLTPDAIYSVYWPALVKGFAREDCRRCGQAAEDFAQRTLANVILNRKPPASQDELASLVIVVARDVLTSHLRECADQGN